LDVPDIEKKLGITVYGTRTIGIGGVIRKEPEDFVVEEILVDGVKASVVPSGCPACLGRYLVCILVKRNWDTLLAVKTVARRLRIKPEQIGFAGIKDANALTAQHISLYGVRPEKISRVKIKDLRIYPVRYVEERISAKLLFGNQFTILVRLISPESSEVEKLVNATMEKLSVLGGVPNFFGHQRFGTVRPITHLVGKAIVKGNVEEAAFTFLAFLGKYENPEIRLAREKLGETRDLKEALRSFPTVLSYERLMLRHLLSYPNDFLGAFRRLPMKLRELFVQAYESFLFNQFLSERMRRGIGLNEVHVGDYVVALNEHGLSAENGEVATSQSLSRLNRAVKRGKACVAIPLIGFKQSLSNGAQGEIEQSVLEKEEVKPEDFKLSSMSEISMRGGLRTVLTPLTDFVAKPTEDHENSSKCKLRLRFTLRKGSYATIPLREFMKPQNPVEAGF